MEILDIVDENDEITGQASREEIFIKKLRHRIVHILMFDQNNRLAVQLRGNECHFCPHHWSTSVGGHVRTKETYEQAALREFKEELGTTGQLEFFNKDLFIGEDKMEMFLVTYKTIYEGPFKLEAGKVDKVEYFSLEEIKEMIERGEKFHPEFLFLLKKHLV